MLHVTAAADDEAEEGPGVSGRAMPEEATVTVGGRTRRRAVFSKGVPAEAASDGEEEGGSDEGSEGEDSEFQDVPGTGRGLGEEEVEGDESGSGDDTDNDGKLMGLGWPD